MKIRELIEKLAKLPEDVQDKPVMFLEHDGELAPILGFAVEVGEVILLDFEKPELFSRQS